MLRKNIKSGVIFGLALLLNPLSLRCLAAEENSCDRELSGKFKSQDASLRQSSFFDVLSAMQIEPYDPERLPTTDIHLFRFVNGRFSFFVAKRSSEILAEPADYRSVGFEKPVHPNGIGLVGNAHIFGSRWSGFFAGGNFPVLARASISQANPFKLDANGRPQKRSTALALKVFGSQNLYLPTETANAVFQNDLNGVLGADGNAINWFDALLTNQPDFDLLKIRKLYEVGTLAGIVIASIQNRQDHSSGFPFIYPQIRPVHSLAELGVKQMSDVRPPVWVMVRPRVTEQMRKVTRPSDFRLEFLQALNLDGNITFDFFAADTRDQKGNIQWEKVGIIIFHHTILSKGVDQHLIFPHDTYNSRRTGQIFEIPEPNPKFNPVPDDIQ